MQQTRPAILRESTPVIKRSTTAAQLVRPVIQKQGQKMTQPAPQ